MYAHSLDAWCTLTWWDCRSLAAGFELVCLSLPTYDLQTHTHTIHTHSSKHIDKQTNKYLPALRWQQPILRAALGFLMTWASSSIILFQCSWNNVLREAVRLLFFVLNDSMPCWARYTSIHMPTADYQQFLTLSLSSKLATIPVIPTIVLAPPSHITSAV